MRVLITNSVPLNGGDEALLRGLILGLGKRLGTRSVDGGEEMEGGTRVLVKDLARCRQLLPDLELGADLEFAGSAEERRQAEAWYAEADVVLSAPGGFFHDHYAIEARLAGLEHALSLGKPVILAGQSVGPFWKPESVRRVREVFSRVHRVCVRDEASVGHLRAVGVPEEKIRFVGDVAFLWRKLSPEAFRRRDTSVPCRNVGLCVRRWPLKDEPAAQSIIRKVAQTAEWLLDTHATERVTFISTCQGVPGYWDDSQLAVQAVASLRPELRPYCHVDARRLSPGELISTLGSLDLFVGMRLHGGLLAMLGGTPVVGLEYETKTSEIFGQMGLSAYQLPHTAPTDAWISVIGRALTDRASLHHALPATLDRLADRAWALLDEVASCR